MPYHITTYTNPLFYTTLICVFEKQSYKCYFWKKTCSWKEKCLGRWDLAREALRKKENVLSKVFFQKWHIAIDFAGQPHGATMISPIVVRGLVGSLLMLVWRCPPCYRGGYDPQIDCRLADRGIQKCGLSYHRVQQLGLLTWRYWSYGAGESYLSWRGLSSY